MDFSGINFPAVFVAALSAFAIGALWYSQLLFGKSWMQESGMTQEKIKKGNMSVIYTLAFLLFVIIAMTFERFLPLHATWRFGATAGALAGLGWVATSFGITYLFEQKSSKLFLINAGYHAVTFVVMGTILGAWR
jgi:hypothetical protein